MVRTQETSSPSFHACLLPPAPLILSAPPRSAPDTPVLSPLLPNTDFRTCIHLTDGGDWGWARPSHPGVQDTIPAESGRRDRPRPSRPCSAAAPPSLPAACCILPRRRRRRRRQLHPAHRPSLPGMAGYLSESDFVMVEEGFSTADLLEELTLAASQATTVRGCERERVARPGLAAALRTFLFLLGCCSWFSQETGPCISGPCPSGPSCVLCLDHQHLQMLVPAPIRITQQCAFRHLRWPPRPPAPRAVLLASSFSL